jgi:hypothetical protein
MFRPEDVARGREEGLRQRAYNEVSLVRLREILESASALDEIPENAHSAIGGPLYGLILGLVDDPGERSVLFEMMAAALLNYAQRSSSDPKWIDAATVILRAILDEVRRELAVSPEVH